MFSALKRHPFPVVAFFRRSLVLIYALPKAMLASLIGPGLELAPRQRERNSDHALGGRARPRENGVTLALRLAGGSLMLLSLGHAVLWRSLHWDEESGRLSPLNARVFAVHAFFVAFVLFALCLLSLARPDLLLAPSELAKPCDSRAKVGAQELLHAACPSLQLATKTPLSLATWPSQLG